MANLIHNMQEGIRSAAASYLKILLPISLLITIVMMGATFSEEPESIIRVLIFAGLMYITVPAFISRPRSTGYLRSAKSWTLSAGDAFLVGALIYFTPTPDYTTVTGSFISLCLLGVIFIALCMLLVRNLRLAGNLERVSLKSDFKSVWRSAHTLLILMFAGLIPPILVCYAVIALQNSGLITQTSLQNVVGFFASSLLIAPSSFLPFIFLTEGLKRACIVTESAAAKDNCE